MSTPLIPSASKESERESSPGTGARTCPSCGSFAAQKGMELRPELELIRCGGCGLIYRGRIPSEDRIREIYGENYYGWDREEGSERVASMKKKTAAAYLDLLSDYLPAADGPPRLLDIGCAHGFLLEAARERGFGADGIEISAAARSARNRGFEVFDRPVHELALPGGSYEVVTMIDVIEHVPDPERLMAEVRRLLMPGGILLIVTPDVESRAAGWMGSAWPHFKEEHLAYFCRRSLSALMKKSGFKPLRIKTAFKYLDFEYGYSHFQRYGTGVLLQLLRFLHSLVPAFLARREFRIPMEMLAIGQRQPAGRGPESGSFA